MSEGEACEGVFTIVEIKKYQKYLWFIVYLFSMDKWSGKLKKP